MRRSSPDDATTVARVAPDSGFANPGRFAQRYQAVYGEVPSAALGG